MSARANCGAQAYASDTLALRQAVDDLLSDVERIGQMTPLDHWEWARRLPEGEEPRQLPDTWSDAVEARSALDERELHYRRAAALRHWGSRKRVLDPAWQARAGRGRTQVQTRLEAQRPAGDGKGSAVNRWCFN